MSTEPTWTADPDTWPEMSPDDPIFTGGAQFVFENSLPMSTAGYSEPTSSGASCDDEQTAEVSSDE